jgi:cell division transport system permease protein
MPYAVREAFAAFRRAPLLAGLSATMIALSLFVIGLFGLAAWNVRQVIQRVESRVEIVAYLRDDADAGSVDIARAQIAEFREVAAVRFVSRDEALANARQELVEFEALFGSLERNPLPASLEIAMRPGQTSADAVREVAGRIRMYPFVEDVRFGNDWLDKVFVLRRVAGAAMMTLGVGFAVVAALIIGAAIRLAIFARREEIMIMRLVGATNGFIRRPFLLEGLMAGALGSLLAVPATYLVFRFLSDSVIELVWLPDSWIVAGVVLGSIFGMGASAVAVHRHLQEI